MAPGVPGTQWQGFYSRDLLAYSAGPPAVIPLSLPIANTAGEWLFALVSWRQDKGNGAICYYPSSVAISDDVHNFWIPVESGLNNTGAVRCAIWMAPAARAAGEVFISPTGVQGAITVLVTQVPAICPWYQVAAQAATYLNHGTAVSLSQDPASGLFTMGMLTWDDLAASVSVTASGWTALATTATDNGNDGSGDLNQDAYYASTTGSTMTISATS